jgi:crotonobetaine/carnitine-CoA ligase
VFVYGVTTPKNVAGEKNLVAAVVPLDPGSFTKEALIAYCRANLERNDVPDIVQVLPEIPRTISEKPIERACIDLLGNLQDA